MSREIMPAEGVPAWMAAMREAVFNAVTEADLIAITKGVVERAKAGDMKSIEFLFRYVVGSPTVRVAHRIEPPGPTETVLDVTPAPIDLGPGPNDPSPDEIASAARTIRLNRKQRQA